MSPVNPPICLQYLVRRAVNQARFVELVAASNGCQDAIVAAAWPAALVQNALIDAILEITPSLTMEAAQDKAAHLIRVAKDMLEATDAR